MCLDLNLLFKQVWGTEVTVPLTETESDQELDSIQEHDEQEEIQDQPIEKTMSKKIVLLDCGHAKNTPGKRSPKKSDGTRFYEYQSNREIGQRVARKLDALGITYHFVLDLNNPEDKSLSARANTANEYCAKYGKENCIFISLHSDAAGDGESWVDSARGWSIYTTKGNTASDRYATIFFEEAQKLLPKHGMTLRKDMSDGDPDYEENFTVIYKAWCPAVLVESLFFTSRTDLAFLESETGKDVCADIVVNGIKRIVAE